MQEGGQRDGQQAGRLPLTRAHVRLWSLSSSTRSRAWAEGRGEAQRPLVSKLKGRGGKTVEVRVGIGRPGAQLHRLLMAHTGRLGRCRHLSAQGTAAGSFTAP